MPDKQPLTIEEVSSFFIRQKTEAFAEVLRYIYGNQPWSPGVLVQVASVATGSREDGLAFLALLSDQERIVIMRDGAVLPPDTTESKEGDTVVCTEKWSSDPTELGVCFERHISSEDPLDSLLKKLVHDLGGTTADDLR